MSWVSLYSGGKDSAYALYQARRNGVTVERLLTVHTAGDSYMYHVPTTDLTRLAAESIGLPLSEVSIGDLGAEEATNAGAQGDAEIEPLEDELRTLSETHDLGGVVAGAIESEFQATRLREVCDRLGIELHTPLWHEDPRELLTGMLDAGFEIMVVQVAAAGLDDAWLGRTLDAEAVNELQALQDRHGVHLLGEGGEYETLVVDGPHMDRRITVEYDTVWDGVRGHIDATDATLL